MSTVIVPVASDVPDTEAPPGSETVTSMPAWATSMPLSYTPVPR
ncbi:MAG: hypothetical protein ACR2FF_03745 [Mycobacteriales bacterium]